MKLLITLSIFIFFCKSGFSQLLFKNNSNTGIKLCIGYYIETDTFKGWVTEGWYTLDAGEAKCLYCKRLTSRYYYYYGYTDDSLHKEYSGNNNLLVASKPFKLLYADNDSINKMSGRRYSYKRFRKIDTENKSIYTVKLGGQQSEEEPKPEEPKIPQDSIITTPSIKNPK